VGNPEQTALLGRKLNFFMEEKMRRVIVAVFAVGFLAVSCGGGNVKKVQNGVFKSVDSTITVGQAFANDATLKGGAWKAYKNDGRQIVSYTVKFSPQQINAQRNDNKERPNFAVANQIIRARNFFGWDNIFQRLKPFEKEEQQQFQTTFESAYKEVASSTPQLSDYFTGFADYSIYLDPWIMERLDSFSYGSSPKSKDDIISAINDFIEVHNRSAFGYAYTRFFVYTNYDGISEFETALKNTVANYNESYRIAKEKLENAQEEWESKDIDPLVTVNKGSVAFFFVMDQANKDAFNIGGMYFEEDLTLNFYNNKKVTWEQEYTTPNKILEYIYNPKSRGFDFL
jgi:hypothetical protein